MAARGHGLARLLLETVEIKANEMGYAVINLDVRKTMQKATDLYESMGYTRFGEHPYSVRVRGETVPSVYYYKVINRHGVQSTSCLASPPGTHVPARSGERVDGLAKAHQLSGERARASRTGGSCEIEQGSGPHLFRCKSPL